MENYQNWADHEYLEFLDQDLGDIDLSSYKAHPNKGNFDFNTKLLFENCTIGFLTATCQIIGQHIEFRNCTISELDCHATYFSAGMKMTNCVINKFASFSSGVHNQNPHEFIIDKCTFNCYVDFFDIYFEGPVKIRNNDFRQGTNVKLYLAVPYGISKGIPFEIENNQGELDKYQSDDPFFGSKTPTSH